MDAFAAGERRPLHPRKLTARPGGLGGVGGMRGMGGLEGPVVVNVAAAWRGWPVRMVQGVGWRGAPLDTRHGMAGLPAGARDGHVMAASHEPMMVACLMSAVSPQCVRLPAPVRCTRLSFVLCSRPRGLLTKPLRSLASQRLLQTPTGVAAPTRSTRSRRASISGRWSPDTRTSEE